MSEPVSWSFAVINKCAYGYTVQGDVHLVVGAPAQYTHAFSTLQEAIDFIQERIK